MSEVDPQAASVMQVSHQRGLPHRTPARRRPECSHTVSMYRRRSNGMRGSGPPVGRLPARGSDRLSRATSPAVTDDGVQANPFSMTAASGAPATPVMSAAPPEHPRKPGRTDPRPHSYQPSRRRDTHSATSPRFASLIAESIRIRDGYETNLGAETSLRQVLKLRGGSRSCWRTDGECTTNTPRTQSN